MDHDAKYVGERTIREKIADYRRSADVARRQLEKTHLPAVRESYQRMIEGFERLASDLEQSLKLERRWTAMETQPHDNKSEGADVRAQQAGKRKT